jgi:hypothetical protein
MAGIQCAWHECQEPAVVWVGGIAKDDGTPLCSEHATEVADYIKHKVKQFMDERDD